MKNNNLDFQKQIEAAFAIKSDISGILHGNQRHVLRGAPNRIVSLFNSVKSCGAFLLESELERAAAISLESSDVVSRYITQCFLIRLSAKNFVIPDFLIERTDGSYIVIEIKPSICGLSDENYRRYETCREILDREGIQFRIVDSKMLPNKYEFYKLNKHYQRGNQTAWSKDLIEMALDVLRNSAAQKIQTSRLELLRAGIPGELSDYLVFHKKLKFADAANTTVEIAV